MLACNYIVSSVEGSSCKEAGVSLNLIVDDGKHQPSLCAKQARIQLCNII